MLSSNSEWNQASSDQCGVKVTLWNEYSKAWALKKKSTENFKVLVHASCLRYIFFFSLFKAIMLPASGFATTK